MIDIKDLRIGNFVFYNTGILSRVEGIKSRDIIYIELIGAQRELMFTTEIHSIPLTEEWLVRLGFENFRSESTEPWDGYRVNGFYLTWLPNAGMYVYALEGQQYDVEVKYVHTLQNIYYLLSEANQELSLAERRKRILLI